MNKNFLNLTTSQFANMSIEEIRNYIRKPNPKILLQL